MNTITITLVAIKAYGRKLPNIGFKK